MEKNFEPVVENVSFVGEKLEFLVNRGDPSTRIIKIQSKFRVNVHIIFNKSGEMKFIIKDAGFEIPLVEGVIHYSLLYLNLCSSANSNYDAYVKGKVQENKFDGLLISCPGDVEFSRAMTMLKSLGYPFLHSQRGLDIDQGFIVFGKKDGVHVEAVSSQAHAIFQFFAPRFTPVHSVPPPKLDYESFLG